MKQLDYNTISTEILLSFIQMETARPTCRMEKVTEIRNIIKQRRLAAVRELKKLLAAEDTIQRLVTHHLKNKMGE